MTRTSIHELTVARLANVYPQASRGGFAKTVRKVLGDDSPNLTFLPDLWWQDEAQQDEAWGQITCVEVEDENPISANKLRLYANLWFLLDAACIDLRLLVTDRWASKLAPIPLQEYFYAAWGADRLTFQGGANANTPR